MKNGGFVVGMVVVIVGGAISIYDRTHGRSGGRGRTIALLGVAIAVVSISL